jgi:hypothetical protein
MDFNSSTQNSLFSLALLIQKGSKKKKILSKESSKITRKKVMHSNPRFRLTFVRWNYYSSSLFCLVVTGVTFVFFCAGYRVKHSQKLLRLFLL